MTHPTPTDMANKYQRDAAYWQAMAGKLAEALADITDNTYVGQAHKPVNERSRFGNYLARYYHKAKIALAEYNAA